MSPLIFALSIQFLGPCSEKPLLAKQWNESFPHVGAATVATLDGADIPYQGTERGLNSAFNTPVGMDALEIISDQEMHSYGWCFAVDGKVPEDYADTISLVGVKQVTWFFAYAYYLNGEWVSQCEPAYKLKPDFICKPANQ